MIYEKSRFLEFLKGVPLETGGRDFYYNMEGHFTCFFQNGCAIVKSGEVRNSNIVLMVTILKKGRK